MSQDDPKANESTCSALPSDPDGALGDADLVSSEAEFEQWLVKALEAERQRLLDKSSVNHRQPQEDTAGRDYGRQGGER